MLLKAGDVVENKVFGSMVLTLRGIGKSEQNAYLDAFKKIKPKSAEIHSLLSSFMETVSDYYTNHCDEIIHRAQTTAQLGNYEEAIGNLVSVPNVCQLCFDKCSEKAATIYQQKIDFEGEQLLQQARVEWQMGKDKNTANRVANILVSINPHSAAFPQAIVLQKEIEQKLDADAKRDWEMKMRQYNDKQEFKRGILETVKAIGVAWGEHRPQSVTKNITRLWF